MYMHVDLLIIISIYARLEGASPKLSCIIIIIITINIYSGIIHC